MQVLASTATAIVGEMFNRWSHVLRWICITLWCSIVIAGLWPFNFYLRNRVRWIQTGNGLDFDAYGQVYSSASWTLSDEGTAENPPFTIELWLQPANTHYVQVTPLLSLEGTSDDQNLSIAQFGSDLVVRGYFRDGNKDQQFRQLWLYDAFRSAQPIFLTMVSSRKGTTFYLDARPEHPERYARICPGRYSGRVILGHAPGGIEPWTGEILRLTVYGRSLQAEDIAEHYRDWGVHKLHAVQGARALYTFDEHSGDIVHDHAGSAPNLIIPARFKPIHLAVLTLPHPFRLHRIDTMVNILGFMPTAFFICAYLIDVKRFSTGKAFICTIALGALTSVGIELLQVFLPSRDSSLLDLINNIVGTILGALLQIGARRYWQGIVCRAFHVLRPDSRHDLHVSVDLATVGGGSQHGSLLSDEVFDSCKNND